MHRWAFMSTTSRLSLFGQHVMGLLLSFLFFDSGMLGSRRGFAKGFLGQ